MMTEPAPQTATGKGALAWGGPTVSPTSGNFSWWLELVTLEGSSCSTHSGGCGIGPWVPAGPWQRGVPPGGCLQVRVPAGCPGGAGSGC